MAPTYSCCDNAICPRQEKSMLMQHMNASYSGVGLTSVQPDILFVVCLLKEKPHAGPVSQQNKLIFAFT